MTVLEFLHTAPFRSVLWNLFLASIPVILAYGLAWGFSRSGKRRNLPLLIGTPVLLLWIAFLPNTCYLITEWRHLLFDDRWASMLRAGDTDRTAMLATAKWALLFLGYSGVGVLLFVLAIRPVEKRVRASGFNASILAPPFFFIISLGVYLGLIVRLNSWDLIQRPTFVWRSTADAVSSPNLLASMGVFALILWVLYEAVDLWIDGVTDRLRGWGGRNAGTRESAKVA